MKPESRNRNDEGNPNAQMTKRSQRAWPAWSIHRPRPRTDAKFGNRHSQNMRNEPTCQIGTHQILNGPLKTTCNKQRATIKSAERTHGNLGKMLGATILLLATQYFVTFPPAEQAADGSREGSNPPVVDNSIAFFQPENRGRRAMMEGRCLMAQAQTLPARPNLEYLKKLAKERLSLLRAEKPSAKLADAQLAIAREYGFSSWRAMKAHIESGPSTAIVSTFVEAIRKGQLSVVARQLKSFPMLANAKEEHGASMLAHAVEWNRPKIVELLLNYGADTRATYGKSAHTPLSWAMTVGAFKSAEVLLKAGVRPDLFCAAGLGRVKAIAEFFDSRGYARPGASQTGSSRFRPDGTRIPGPPTDPVELASDALYIVSRNGRADAVRFLLTQKVDLSFRAYMGGTPLHWAHFNGSREVIEMLLAAGSDPSARDDVMKATPRAFGIMVPCEWGIPAQVRQRLREDPTLAKIADGRGTPLHEAARGGHAAIVKWLLKDGADPTARDIDEKTPLDIAREKEHAEVVALLESAIAKSARKAPQAAGTSAASMKKPSHDWKPIMDAAFYGDAKKVQSLIAAGADPNVVSRTAHRYRPLHRAIEHKKTMPKHDGHDAVVKALLKLGADPKLSGTPSRFTALQLAAMDEPRFVQYLRPHFEPLDIFNASLLADDQRVVELLKKDKSLAKARDENKLTPLHYCAASAIHEVDEAQTKALVRIATALLRAGADPNATYLYNNEWPIPVLFQCCGHQNNAALTRVLLEAGADPCDGESVFHASDEGHGECLALFAEHVEPKKLAVECTGCLSNQLHWGGTRGMKWLLAHGADPNALNPERGDNALHEAARNGASEAVIATLLKHGADPSVKNRDGLTAVDVAKRAKKSRAAQQLQKHLSTSGKGGRS